MKHKTIAIFSMICSLFVGVLIAAQVPDDTAPEMKVKSRKLVFKADPKGLDWAARGSLTKTKTGRWIAAYRQSTQHGRGVPTLVVVHTSDDEGRTWSKPNSLPDGTSVTGAPLRSEHDRVEPREGGVLTCPNGDLLFIANSHDNDGKPYYQGRTIQWRSTDNGASWNYEGRSSGILAGEVYALGKTVEGGSIYVTIYGVDARLTDGDPGATKMIRDKWWLLHLYRSDDNALTWEKVSTYGTLKDRINETGVVCIDKDTIMIVCRTFDEDVTKMRISRDRGKTWGPMTDITEYVHVVQQPKLTKFPEEPGRIYLTGRDRIEEFKQRNCLWYTDDVGKTWKMKPVDGDNYFVDSGYGEILKRKDGDLYYLGYRGTDDAADSWEFVLESDYDGSLAGEKGVKKANYNIMEYGAIGDGQKDDAPAIQKAIDICAKAGGGRVLIPAGRTFLSSPLEMKSGVDLRIQASATLKAVSDPDAYGDPRAFLFAKGADGMTLSGGGSIDGDSLAWMSRLEDDIFRSKPGRPGMIYFEACDAFTMRDLTIRNAPYWTVHLAGCDGVLIESVRILNDLRVPNSDGIDPDHCRNVRIANCHIEAGDDCIVLKNTKDLAKYGPTENITVTGCILKSTSCAIKIGTESVDDFRNIVISSCVITGSNRGLGIQLRDSGVVENIIFSDIIIETSLHGPRWWGKAEPIYVTAIPRTKETKLGKIRNVRFSNILCRGESGVFVQGWNDGVHIENLVFDNVRVQVDHWTDRAGGFRDARPGIGRGVYKDKISAFYCEQATDVTFRDCRAAWGENKQPYFGSAIETRHVKDLKIENFTGKAAFPDRDPDRRIILPLAEFNIDKAVERFAPGWKVTDCGSAMNPGLRAEWGGRKKVLVTHPMSEAVPCLLSKKVRVPSGKKTTLTLEVGHHPDGDWVLVVRTETEKLASEVISEKTCGGGTWKKVTVDLSDYAGQTIRLKLANRANDWKSIEKMKLINEVGFWSRLAIESR